MMSEKQFNKKARGIRAKLVKLAYEGWIKDTTLDDSNETRKAFSAGFDYGIAATLTAGELDNLR